MAWWMSLLVAWYGLAAIVAVVGLAVERRAEGRQDHAEGARIAIVGSRAARSLRRSRTPSADVGVAPARL
jgi:hypothetical protein